MYNQTSDLPQAATCPPDELHRFRSTLTQWLNVVDDQQIRRQLISLVNVVEDRLNVPRSIASRGERRRARHK